MASLPCPHCGQRDLGEFHYGGDAGKKRPARAADDREWSEYRFFRKNLKGVAQELWCHVGGCGRWAVIERDTLTHLVLSARDVSS
jgi:sarcosine oxidase subunit delta